MFDTLSDRLSSVFSKLTGRGLLTEANVDDALREVRRALLEADVALEVVKDFLAKVREKAIGEEVIKSVSPGQTVIKIAKKLKINEPIENGLTFGENSLIKSKNAALKSKMPAIADDSGLCISSR